MQTFGRLLIVVLALFLQACGSVKYTVDDGRKVDETLLSNIRLFGQGERLLRPAIYRSSTLNDPDCSTQWELPFGVASSYDLAENDRVAWVRALQVDERLTVISSTSESGLKVGDKLVELDGYGKDDATKMLEKLAKLRDAGEPFPAKTANGETVSINPFKLCRGYVRLAPPDKPGIQDYHWLMSFHPLEIFNPQLSTDEALWMVLWTQGLSEEGGARMKTFHYSKEFILTLVDIASIAMGLNGAAQAAKVAANQAISSASSAATKAVSEEAAKQIIEAAGKSAAEAAAKEYAQRVGEEIGKELGKELGKSLGTVLTGSFISRAGYSLSAVSWVASTTFDYADTWAFQRMMKMGADPVAGATLHRKLMDRSLTRNAFALDDERLGSLVVEARKMQREEMLMAAIRGASLENFALQVVDLPDSSTPEREMEMSSVLDKPGSPNQSTLTTTDMPSSMTAESEKL